MNTEIDNLNSTEVSTSPEIPETIVEKTDRITDKITDKITEQKIEDTSKPKEKKKRLSPTLILTIASIVLVFLTVFLIRIGIRNGGKSLVDNFTDNYESEHDRIYKDLTDFWANKVKEANKVINYQTISIANVKKKADLEVLMVSDVVYEIENKDDNKYHLTRWVQIPGTCTFTVNLKASEFITDTIRNTVTVRIPHIVSNTQINENKIKELFYKDDSGLLTSTFSKAEVIKAGEDLVDRQLRDGYVDIRKKFQENPNYEKQAKESAVKVIEKLIKDLNPGNNTLQVFVEFAE